MIADHRPYDVSPARNVSSRVSVNGHRDFGLGRTQNKTKAFAGYVVLWGVHFVRGRVLRPDFRG